MRPLKLFGGNMRGRINTTILYLAGAYLAAFLFVVWLAFEAGSRSQGLGFFGALSGGVPGQSPALIIWTLLIAAFASWFLWWWLGKKVSKPVSDLTDFARRQAGGDYKTKLDLRTGDDFETIADNLNRATERAAQAVFNQDAQDSLQRSVTDFLTIMSQIAYGDLTLRGKVTNDALGNVVDSVNYMLDNFSKVLERVRKAAIDVQTNANDILISSEEM